MTDKKARRFTFDSDKDNAEIPTLTSLLYKKNVVNSAGSAAKAPQDLKNDLRAGAVSLDPTVTTTASRPETASSASKDEIPVDSVTSSMAALKNASSKAPPGATKPATPGRKSNPFTFDSSKDGAEVPSLASLLDSKTTPRTTRGVVSAEETTLEPTITSMTLSQIEEAASTPPQSAEPQREASSVEVVRSDMASSRSAPAASKPSSTPSGNALPASDAKPRIVPAAQSYEESVRVHCTRPESLPRGAPLTAGIQGLLEKARLSAALIFEARGADTYTVTAVAGLRGERSVVWDGMQFTRQDFSDLIGRLDKFGFAEFSTLGAAGQGNFDRMAMRCAFQAEGSEWVTLVRVKGSVDAIVVALSPSSIQMQLPAFQSACLGASGQAAA